jgi:hypothetical protein
MIDTQLNKDAKESFTVTRRSILLEENVSATKIPLIVMTFPYRVSSLSARSMTDTLMSEDVIESLRVTPTSIILKVKILRTEIPITSVNLPIGVTLTIKICYEGVPHRITEEGQTNWLIEVVAVIVSKINTKLTESFLVTILDLIITTIALGIVRDQMIIHQDLFIPIIEI